MLGQGSIYEEHARYDLWLKMVLGGVLALTLILGFRFLRRDIVASAVMFGVTGFDGLLFYSIMPRSFRIYPDRLVICLGAPFSVKIPFSEIITISPVSGSSALVYSGLRLATSTRSVIEIVRRKGSGLVISPSNRDQFIDQLNQAIKTNSSSYKYSQTI